MEAAAKDTKDLQATSNPPPPGLNFIASGRRDQIKQLNHCTDENKTCKASHKRHMENQILRICHHCGGHHFACRFYNDECRRCKKIRHIAKVCRSKSVSSGPKSTDYLQDSEIPITEDTFYELFMMQDNPILILLEIYQVPVEMELDTGASLTLINRATHIH